MGRGKDSLAGVPITPPDPLNIARILQHILVFVGLGAAFLPRALQHRRARAVSDVRSDGG